MATPKHLDELAKGVESWNLWRQQNQDLAIDLSNVSLRSEVIVRKLEKTYTYIVCLHWTILMLLFSLLSTYLKNSIREQAGNLNLEFALISPIDFRILIAILGLGFLISLAALNIKLSNEIIKQSFLFFSSNLVGLNLEGIDLSNVNLAYADFGGVDISHASLENANLEGANLAYSKALNTNFSFANFTGVCVENWEYNNSITVGIVCSYIYQTYGQQVRHPQNNRDFAPGEFAEILQDNQKRKKLLRRTVHDLEKGKSDSNLKKIVELTHESAIEAVFDPYLDDKAIKYLEDLKSYGASISPHLKLLVSQQKVKMQKITKSSLERFFQSHSIAGEIRQMRDGEHRQFMLLADGCSLILGCSLNCIDKNEKYLMNLMINKLKSFFMIDGKTLHK